MVDAALVASNNLRVVHDEDLTERVHTRPAAELRRLEERYLTTHARVPLAGAHDSCHRGVPRRSGPRRGCTGKGLVRYRLLVARREE